VGGDDNLSIDLIGLTLVKITVDHATFTFCLTVNTSSFAGNVFMPVLLHAFGCNAIQHCMIFIYLENLECLRASRKTMSM
jgi:hypothetical protein